MAEQLPAWTPAPVPAGPGVVAAGSPYMFLAHYGVDDRQVFFGRRRETAVLLSDVISARLVVLFAKTGRGKTSLINAGVRPRLEELGYRTFYVRVERDPTEAVRQALGVDSGAAAVSDQGLAALLKATVDRLGTPVVLFLDQFEEFFITLLDEIGQQRARAFVTAIGELYRDRESGVHVVFSMREEYFVEMDAFREAIPAIFHADSTLRLLGLDPTQAREALVGPAQHAGVRVDDDLADRLTVDLGAGGYIEPARLQIVCDSLWARHSGDRMTLADYEVLGGALQILDQRLGAEIDALADDQLKLFEAMVSELRTERSTKYRREFSELRNRLQVSEERLGELVDRLVALRLVRADVWRGVRYVEWTSDYLAERTEHLRAKARSLRLTRTLAAAVASATARARAAGVPLPLLTPPQDGSPLFMDRKDFADVCANVELLHGLNQEHLSVLVLASLEHRIDMGKWISRALAGDLDVRELLRAELDHPEVGGRSENAVLALEERGDPESLDLLKHALTRPAVAPAAAEALGRLGTAEAIAALAEVLQDGDPVVAAYAIDVLRRLGTQHAVEALGAVMRDGDGAVVLRAGVALTGLASGPPDQPVAVRAADVLDRVLAGQELRILDVALQHGLDTRTWFQTAYDRGVDPWPLLADAITRAEQLPVRAEHAVRLLVDLPGAQAEELLETARHHEAVAETAAKTLTARKALEKSSVDRQPAVDRPAPGEMPRGLGEREWHLLLDSLSIGNCLPVLGAGAALVQVPAPDTISRKWAIEYDLPATAESDLAVAADVMSIRFDPVFAKELLAREMSAAIRHGVDEAELSTSSLSSLPVSAYLVCSYDTSLGAALTAVGRMPQVVNLGLVPSVVAPSVEESVSAPVVYHLFGSIDAPDSMVVTSDEQLDWFAAVTRDPERLPSRLRSRLFGAQLLLLGLAPHHWTFRLLRALGRGQRTSDRQRVIVQIPPPMDDAESQLLQAEMSQLGALVYWGTVVDFTAELRERLSAGMVT